MQLRVQLRVPTGNVANSNLTSDRLHHLTTTLLQRLYPQSTASTHHTQHVCQLLAAAYTYQMPYASPPPTTRSMQWDSLGEEIFFVLYERKHHVQSDSDKDENIHQEHHSIRTRYLTCGANTASRVANTASRVALYSTTMYSIVQHCTQRSTRH